MRRLLWFLAFLLLAAIVSAALGLAAAHRAIDRLAPALPPPEAVAAVDAEADLPVGLWWINTASQPIPRAAVIEPTRDPSPEAPYVMSHVAFVLGWSDGRLLLIDLGMDRETALRFGAPMERLPGAEPIEPLATVAEVLGADVDRVAAVAFTHLHEDHTAGVTDLCAVAEAVGIAEKIRLIRAPLQADETNYTTLAGRAQLDAAPCLETRTLKGGPLYALPGFPGVAILAAAGHTPGSQVFVAHVQGEGGIARWLLTGDVVNHADALRRDLPKPHVYSLLVVPESTERLGQVRRYLWRLVDEHGFAPLVSHDQRQLEESGLPRWPAGGGR